MPMKPVEDLSEEYFADIITSVRNKLNVEVSREEIFRVIKESSHINEFQIMLMFKEQDKFCIKCGECCRTSTPIDFTKSDLKNIAKRVGISYKKLKKRIKASPRGKHQIFKIPGKPCPFLEGRATCSIYDLRPLSCQKYPVGKGLAEILSGRSFQLPTDSCFAAKEMLTMTILGKIVINLYEKKFGKSLNSPILIPPEVLELSQAQRLRWFHDNVDTISSITRAHMEAEK